MSGCCSPGRLGGASTAAALPLAAERPGEDGAGMALIPSGPFRYGCDRNEGPPGDGEGPSRLVEVDAFLIDCCAVTNARFRRFVDATAYVSEAERLGWSFVFAGLLPDNFADTKGVEGAPWWRQVFGAAWHQPEGPHSNIVGREGDPVVQVSHNDALAFCAWAGKRLPSEVEWEKASRGGLEGARFPWGDDETPNGVARCNVWQGRFPDLNERDDGYYGLAPANAFEANGFGLHNCVGNAWEWCDDWSATRRFAGVPGAGELRVIRGGSYLCHPSYCWRYRNAARAASAPDSATGHIAFRCAR